MRYRTILLLFSVFNKLLARSVTQINLLLVIEQPAACYETSNVPRRNSITLSL